MFEASFLFLILLSVANSAHVPLPEESAYRLLVTSDDVSRFCSQKHNDFDVKLVSLGRLGSLVVDFETRTILHLLEIQTNGIPVIHHHSPRSLLDCLDEAFKADSPRNWLNMFSQLINELDDDNLNKIFEGPAEQHHCNDIIILSEWFHPNDSLQIKNSSLMSVITWRSSAESQLTVWHPILQNCTAPHTGNNVICPLYEAQTITNVLCPECWHNGDNLVWLTYLQSYSQAILRSDLANSNLHLLNELQTYPLANLFACQSSLCHNAQVDDMVHVSGVFFVLSGLWYWKIYRSNTTKQYVHQAFQNHFGYANAIFFESIGKQLWVVDRHYRIQNLFHSDTPATQGELLRPVQAKLLSLVSSAFQVSTVHASHRKLFIVLHCVFAQHNIVHIYSYQNQVYSLSQQVDFAKTQIPVLFSIEQSLFVGFNSHFVQMKLNHLQGKTRPILLSQLFECDSGQSFASSATNDSFIDFYYSNLDVSLLQNKLTKMLMSTANQAIHSNVKTDEAPLSLQRIRRNPSEQSTETSSKSEFKSAKKESNTGTIVAIVVIMTFIMICLLLLIYFNRNKVAAKSELIISHHRRRMNLSSDQISSDSYT